MVNSVHIQYINRLLKVRVIILPFSTKLKIGIEINCKIRLVVIMSTHAITYYL